MSDKQVLAAFFAATIAVAAGSAWAASEPAQTSPPTAAQKEFGKLSADGARGFQDLTLARLSIYDGKTDQAKKFVDMADKAFVKAKGDDTVFMKDEHDLKTADQAAAMAKKMPPGAATSSAASDKTASDQKSADASNTAPKAGPVAWLPVDGAISLNEDYTMNPTKAKAVADADKSLAKGDRKGALDQLKLASVDTSVVLEVVPLDQTISDVQSAAQMIDSGKYYEGSQMLRKVQTAARYDVMDILGTPKAAAAGASPTSTAPAKPAPTTH